MIILCHIYGHAETLFCKVKQIFRLMAVKIFTAETMGYMHSDLRQGFVVLVYCNLGK